MKNRRSLITIIFILLILTACEKSKEYVYFNYGCNNTEYYKCELKNNKLNCDVKYPTCEGYEFLGWYDSKEEGNEVDLYSSFKNKSVIYVHWKEKEEPSIIIDEPSSSIETSSYIEEPSSIIEEPSSIKEEPSSQKTYMISFNLNGGTGSIPQKSVTYGGVLPSVGSIPTRTAYTFLGWYDSKTGGTQYYNEKNVPVVNKYNKPSNITLYARWRENILSIRYNSNGGTWKTSSSKYGLNVDGTVIIKGTNEIYEQKVKYGYKLDSDGLIDYNGSLFNWTKKYAFTNSGKEYFIENKGVKKELNQKAQYTARQLAEYAGCDLSKSDCTTTVKVNWFLTTGIGSNIKVSDKVKTVCNYVFNPDSLQIRLYRCPCVLTHSDGRPDTTYVCMYTAALPGGGTKITMKGFGVGDNSYETEIAKKTINFARYQMGAFTYEQPGAIEKESRYEFAKAFMIMYKTLPFTDYRFKFNSAGEAEILNGNCVQCYSERVMVERYDSGKYKKLIDDIYEETRYFIMVNDDGSLTPTLYDGPDEKAITVNMTKWSRNGMKFMDILREARTSTENYRFKYYRESNIYDCRNILVE